MNWVFKKRMGLIVLGGGYSGYCFWYGIMVIDMGILKNVYVVIVGNIMLSFLIVVELGCSIGDIIWRCVVDGFIVFFGL